MSFLQDNLIPFFKKRALSFIDRYEEAEGVYSFRFAKDQDVSWKAGQYGLFSITHKKIKNPTKPFTVSSIPSENKVQITTRISDTPSEFKQALLDMQPGTNVVMRGPVGPFYLKDDSPVLMIAGGMGITPFRSMLKQLATADEGSRGKSPIQLLYMDSKQTYVFRHELDEIAERIPLSVTYLDTSDLLPKGIESFIASHRSNGKYYVAGPKSMVDQTYDYLLKQHIAKSNIVKDVFFGY